MWCGPPKDIDSASRRVLSPLEAARPERDRPPGHDGVTAIRYTTRRSASVSGLTAECTLLVDHFARRAPACLIARCTAARRATAPMRS
jgi:hypothetical protein